MSPQPANDSISAKSDVLPRAELDHWQRFVKEKMDDNVDTEYRLYNVISSHLLPLLHEFKREAPPESEVCNADSTPIVKESEWTSSLGLSGFAKVGYPGLIYAQGPRENLEKFVENVKAMQWLALKVRFVEPVPQKFLQDAKRTSGWGEFQRVGEVVEEMKRLGREEYLFEMGIGSSGAD